MSLSDFEKGFRALGWAFHRAAEDRMERAGKVAPLTSNEPDRTAALTLGSMAQAFEKAADNLADQVRAHYDLPPKGAPDGNGSK